MVVLEKPTKDVEFYDHQKNFHIDPKGGGYFVFGSNLKGIHGKGAAKTARLCYGAKYGYPKGFCGRSYAIPTKDAFFHTLPLAVIEKYVKEFVSTTQIDLDGSWFLVTAVGCGLAGYKAAEIAPMFRGAINCWFPDSWEPFLRKNEHGKK